MKQLLLISSIAAFLLVACNRPRYYDLTAGEYVNLEKDNSTGKMMNTKTHKPVYMYVDTKTHDTIYAATGEVINGHVVTSGNKYWYDADLQNEMNATNGDYKIKTDNIKIKVEDGVKKVKKD